MVKISLNFLLSKFLIFRFPSCSNIHNAIFSCVVSIVCLILEYKAHIIGVVYLIKLFIHTLLSSKLSIKQRLIVNFVLWFILLESLLKARNLIYLVVFATRERLF